MAGLWMGSIHGNSFHGFYMVLIHASSAVQSLRYYWLDVCRTVRRNIFLLQNQLDAQYLKFILFCSKIK